MLDKAGRVHIPAGVSRTVADSGPSPLEVTEDGILIRRVDEVADQPQQAQDDHEPEAEARGGLRGIFGSAGAGGRSRAMAQTSESSPSATTDLALERSVLTASTRRGQQDGARVGWRRPGNRCGPVCGDQRAFGQRQDDAAQLHQRAGPADRRRRIRIYGEEIGGWNRTTHHWRREQVGFIFQSLGSAAGPSAYENVELMLRLNGVGAQGTPRAAVDALELVGLTKWIDHRPYELSGGQQQRVAIARALRQQPTADHRRRTDRQPRLQDRAQHPGAFPLHCPRTQRDHAHGHARHAGRRLRGPHHQPERRPDRRRLNSFGTARIDRGFDG